MSTRVTRNSARLASSPRVKKARIEPGSITVKTEQEDTIVSPTEAKDLVANLEKALPKTEDEKLPVSQVKTEIEEVVSPIKTPKKAAKYKLTPGETPFPDWPHPTREECQQVVDLLSTVHGRPERKLNNAPSVTVPGCGEVPAVLDALMRTMLSAATTSANASRAFQKIVDVYGLLTDGEGKGSVDWDKVRLGSQKQLFETIQCGGLAQNKSKNIKAILDLVHEENQERAATIIKAKDTDPDLPGAENETAQEKSNEVALAHSHILSLNHLHSLSTTDAMDKLTSYPGVGVKTASCVLLFNFERASFAVDTHVYRLCRWLGWVPNYATRDQTYSHCDARIPDEFKYDLHKLFWSHGKYW